MPETEGALGHLVPEQTALLRRTARTSYPQPAADEPHQRPSQPQRSQLNSSTHHVEHRPGGVPNGIWPEGLAVGAEWDDEEAVAGGCCTGVGTAVWSGLGEGIDAYESTKMSFCAPSLKLYRSV